MKINRAIGLGLFLLILQFLAGGIWTALESTLISTLNVTQTALGAAEVGLEQVSTFPSPQLVPLP